MSSLVRYASSLTAPLSKAVRAGAFLFLSGQTPKNADLTPMRGSIEDQASNVIETIRSTLAEFDLDLTSGIPCTVWLSDMKLMAAFNPVYASYFAGGLPVRSTVEAKLSNGVDVEIEVTCWAPTGT